MMATYNGEKYIQDQIKSLQNQTFKNWNLYISDDGSSDQTVKILKEIQNSESRIKLILRNTDQYHGAFANYFYLMRYVKANCSQYDYYFYCDQDDIWSKNKLREEIETLIKIEQKYSKQKPAFCYCDLEMCDVNGQDMHDKMSNHICTQFSVNPYNSLFKDQYVWGTTIGHNYALWQLLYLGCAEEIKNDISHDVYISKYAMAYAKCEYIPKPLVNYRRTGDNVSSTPGNYNVLGALKRLTDINLLINNAARNYWGTLYFAYHVPVETPLIIDIKKCFLSFKNSVYFFKKYNILKNERFLGKCSTKVILYSGIYKQTRFFKNKENFK